MEDDPLDNGGNSHVIGGTPHATIQGPDGKSRGQTHLGHKAWCSVCQSVGEIAAGARISDYLRGWDEILGAKEAIDGDIVLCKCERHPRIVSVYARSCTYIDSASGAPAAATPAALASAQSTGYDEQFTLRDANGSPLADTYYTLASHGTLIHGVTDSYGRTARHETDGAQAVRVYLGHRQEA
ncbi:hypothetical protein [Paraburkholderia ultramafica]|uniref:hypothetical protein n=1 Tax=Paraburkholderia ultramafica TaxID=1544867 RepID=UPI00158266C9|nr:hypothetical protein [Paraburkholderia ultramafica]